MIGIWVVIPIVNICNLSFELTIDEEPSHPLSIQVNLGNELIGYGQSLFLVARIVGFVTPLQVLVAEEPELVGVVHMVSRTYRSLNFLISSSMLISQCFSNFDFPIT